MKDVFTDGEVMISISDVKRITGLSKSTIYAEIKAGRIPKPVRLTRRRSAWIKSEVIGFLQDRIDDSRNFFKGEL